MALCLASGLDARADNGERWDSMSFTAFKRYVHNDISSGLCFAQDRQGFVWIGTQAGLVRWDGNRHVKYLADARDDALPDSYVMSVHVDTQGRLWAGMNSGGLVRYDPEHDNFIRYRASPTGLRDPRVAAMADDGVGGLWIATGSGLEHLAADGKFNRLGDDYGAAALPDGGIDALLHDADGGLWVGTRRGLFHLKQGQAGRQILLGGKPNMPISSRTARAGCGSAAATVALSSSRQGTRLRRRCMKALRRRRCTVSGYRQSSKRRPAKSGSAPMAPTAASSCTTCSTTARVASATAPTRPTAWPTTM